MCLVLILHVLVLNLHTSIDLTAVSHLEWMLFDPSLWLKTVQVK